MADENTPYDTAEDPVLFDWLQQAYLRIQRQSNYWSFLHSRGLIFSTVADTASYSLPLVRDIDVRTTYALADGSSIRIPLFKGCYRFWVEEERYSIIPSSQPLELIEAPYDSWILYPTPDGIYHIYGDYWGQPDTFDDENAEPIWHEDFHNLVWLVALGTGVPRTLEKHFAESAVAEAASNIPSIMTEFQRRYLSDFRGMR